MTTCKEIQELLEKSEIENFKYELKSSRILKNDNWKDNLAKEFVAFANRTGGKVIIGLQDKGTFDGEVDYDINALKGDIDNIIHNKISPIINYNFEFLKCEGGDLSIITIEKKKDIPYAYIVKREGVEIKSRIYYIRTPHGKRLVSDSQLENLFSEKKGIKIQSPKETKPDIQLIKEYLDMIKTLQFSPKNLMPMLNRIHNQFIKISHKEDFTDNELDIFINYVEIVNNYILNKNNDLKKIILGTIRLFVLKPKFLEIIKSGNYHNFKKLYESGYNNSEITLILYTCGYFKRISTEIYKAIDQKDTDLLDIYINLLVSTKIEENKYDIIKNLRIKIENLKFDTDVNLINKIESITSCLESYQ